MEPLKPMPQKGDVIMRFEWFTIYKRDGHSLWLEQDDGEGMTFPKAELMGFLSKVWSRF